MSRKIYILHENGANSHYRALKYLCQSKNSSLVYREFSIFKSILKSIIKSDKELLKKQLLNIYFLTSLIFSKNKKIVLGMAPYDFRLLFLSFLLRKHQVYYHTSWTSWDKSFYPKKLFVNSWLIKFWEKFLNYKILHIFAVSSETKKELIKNVKIDLLKISVVYHALDDTIYKPMQHNIKLDFIYVGRLEKQKGIEEILEYFSKNNNIILSIVGSGTLESVAKEYASKYENIHFLGFIKDQNRLAKIYSKHDFLILNSKKMYNWEELFGMVIIEAMACGIVPITTNHKGPIEIITNKENGFIFSENEYIKGLDNIIELFNTNKKRISIIKDNAIQRAKDFSVERIAKKWELIFE